MKKTNVMRELDRAKIPYEAFEYTVDLDDLSAINVASKTGTDITSLFKTLALFNEKKELIIACIPGADELDLKKLAILANSKRVEMVELKLLQSVTGYVRGGCSPIGIKKKHISFIHNSVLEKDKIYISGGQRGTQIKISPTILINFLNMKIGNIIIE